VKAAQGGAYESGARYHGCGGRSDGRVGGRAGQEQGQGDADLRRPEVYAVSLDRGQGQQEGRAGRRREETDGGADQGVARRSGRNNREDDTASDQETADEEKGDSGDEIDVLVDYLATLKG
jgi:hypothetical protein